ncbi:MAG: N-acylglucosamine 2-epimerase [Chitinophagaceae bacterium]|nr:MAG: N-acylglucosamine 2-epimerase [Chitinophagaceae bacterium]
MNSIRLSALFLLVAFQGRGQDQISPGTRIADEMARSVRAELLDKYYPGNTDTLYGGFITTYTYDFRPTGPQDKFLVTQARHIWTTSKASLVYPEDVYYKTAARNGFLFLKDKMLDHQYGGFYSLVDRAGKDKSDILVPKDTYSNAFAIFALSAYFGMSKDTAALALAKTAFYWLEKHSHDARYSGYFQHLKRDGTPVTRSVTTASTSDIGYKDQNSSIHLLEAFTELYQVWPDPLVKNRLQEMLALVRDKITSAKGSLTLFFTPDWQPVSYRDSSEAIIMKHRNLDHISAGHDVETAFLMLEASHVLGIKNDRATLAVAKRMVDHALKNAWDDSLGGFYDQAYYFSHKPGITITRHSKNWWAQAEGLNTLLLMADLFPDDPMGYYDQFVKLWAYTSKYLIDHEHGDWYEEGLDGEPGRKTALKAHIWKATYHNYRSLSSCISRLKSDGR